MCSYYDDDELGPVMRERDEDALAAAIEERERLAAEAAARAADEAG